MSLLTISGALSTIGISYLLRRVPFLKHVVVGAEAHFVFFVVYGLAISLIAAASKQIRRRDTVIVILAATIAWVIFVETRQLLGMIRFLVFTSLATLGVLFSDRAWSGTKPWRRVVSGAILPAGLCCAAGLAYYGLVGRLGHAPTGLARELVAGGAWGFSLGLAVGLGLALGSEALRWMNKED